MKDTLIDSLIRVPLTVVGALGLAAAHRQAGRVVRRDSDHDPAALCDASHRDVKWLAMDVQPAIWGAERIVRVAGSAPSQWMLSPRMALSSVALYSLWHGLGFDVVIVLSAVSSVPKAVLEAGTIDSASAWQRFRRVTIPMLSPTLSFWSSSPLQAACRRSRRFLPRLAAQVVPIMAPPHCCC